MATTSTATTTATTRQVRPDTRNLEWKNNNIGSKLLNSMGWKDGMAVGKNKKTITIVVDEEEHQQQQIDYSTEGIRVTKRQDGLGLGATSNVIGEVSNRHNHVADFASILSSLQQHHGVVASNEENKNKKKKSKKRNNNNNDSNNESTSKSIQYSTNRMTNMKVRRSKFTPKSEHDMKCIFGHKNHDAFKINHQQNEDIELDMTQQQRQTNEKKKKSRKSEKKNSSVDEIINNDDNDKKEKKSSKKRKKE